MAIGIVDGNTQALEDFTHETLTRTDTPGDAYLKGCVQWIKTLLIQSLISLRVNMGEAPQSLAATFSLRG